MIEELDLKPHPEGGWYREMFRSGHSVMTPHGPRAALTTIYYLLQGNQTSRWHTVDADEVWHFYAGAPLDLFTYQPVSRELVSHRLSIPEGGGAPVAIAPAGIWQAARSLGDYTLVGCTVAPGFEFAGFRFVASLPECEEHFSGALGSLRDLL